MNLTYYVIEVVVDKFNNDQNIKNYVGAFDNGYEITSLSDACCFDSPTDAETLLKELLHGRIDAKCRVGYKEVSVIKFANILSDGGAKVVWKNHPLLQLMFDNIDKAEKTIDESRRVIELVKFYPDTFKISSDRWGKKRYSCSDLNSQCNEMELGHSCGCCDDAPLYCYPFVAMDGGIKIYAGGIPYIIGERDPETYRDIPDANWQEVLKKDDISDIVIEKVQKYFDEEKDNE